MNARKAGTTDYRDFHPKGQKPKNDRRLPGQQPRQWWALERGSDVSDSIQATVNFLQKNQEVRIRQAVISARLYGNLGMWGPAGASMSRLLNQQTAMRDRITSNETQSIIDTLTARVGETKPRPYFLTSGGDYRQQRKAKKLNQFVEGVFYETKTYDVGLEAFRDGAIWGDGFVFVYAQGGKIRHERVLSSELWVDEVEGQYGFPRNLYRVKTVDRDELVGYFPESKKEIMEASATVETGITSQRNVSDMVTVVEAWHLGVTNEKGEVEGGKHAIALVAESKMLLEPEEWEYGFFPFARFSWCKRPVGYWSQGLCEQLQGEQLELNKELWLIQRSMHMAGTVKVFVHTGSKVVKETINNEVGTIINYTGQKPSYETPAPIHEVYFTNVEKIRERMRNHAGVSELATSSKKPLGLNSGVAIRNFEDVESDRHRSISRANDNLYLQIAALDVAMAREISKSGKMSAVRVPGKLSFDMVDFKKDIGSLKDTEFVMQCFPVSRLPRDPSGRLATIQEYIQAGFISPRQGRKALDFADIDSIESLANAQEDLISKTLDAIVDDGDFSPPEPTDDLSMAKEMVIEYIQRFRCLDLEPDKLAMLRTFSQQIDMLQQMAMPPAMPGAAPGAPQAAPMPQPQSDLVQNVPGAPAAAV